MDAKTRFDRFEKQTDLPLAFFELLIVPSRERQSPASVESHDTYSKARGSLPRPCRSPRCGVRACNRVRPYARGKRTCSLCDRTTAVRSLLSTSMSPHRVEPSSAPPCPNCLTADVRWLAFTSMLNDADVYQCLACGCAWTESRDGYAMYFESRPLRRPGSGTHLPRFSSRPDLGTRGRSGPGRQAGANFSWVW
jgi:hypothetical protein